MNDTPSPPPSKTSALGKTGEAAAAEFLRTQGYELIEANWHARVGEIDLVVRQGDQWVFVEVKTRRSNSAAPLEAITPRKRERMIRAAYMYANSHHIEDGDWRIDAIAVTLDHNNRARIEHIQDVLTWE